MKTIKLIATGILAVTALSGIASGQTPQMQQLMDQNDIDLPVGRLYVFHSSPQGDCPGIDWHVVAHEKNVLSGVVAWNDMQSLARINGTVNKGNFELTATEVGGQGRTAKVTGKVQAGIGFLTADVEGPGVSCKSLEIPWFSPQRKG